MNRIEVCGTVGSLNVNNLQGSKVARFSLATNYSFRGNDGGIIVETTWFSVTVWESDKINNLDHIQRGKNVKVCGRVRMHNYIDANGNDRASWEIVASELKILED